MKLYEISNELAAILGHDEEELSQEVAERIDQLQVALDTKIENLLGYRQGLLADAEAMEAEAARLKKRADTATRRADWLKTYLHDCLQRMAIGKISTTTFTATIAKSPLKVVIEEGLEIPFEYAREKRTVEFDKKLALDDFKAGKTLPPGITVVQGTHLKIS